MNKTVQTEFSETVTAEDESQFQIMTNLPDSPEKPVEEEVEPKKPLLLSSLEQMHLE